MDCVDLDIVNNYGQLICRYEPSPSPYYCSAGNGPPPQPGPPPPPGVPSQPGQQANSHHPQQPPPPPPLPSSLHPAQGLGYDCARGRLTPPHPQANHQQYVSCKMEAQMHAPRDIISASQHHMAQPPSSTSPPLAVSQSANPMYPGPVESPEQNSASSMAPNYFPWMKSQFGEFACPVIIFVQTTLQPDSANESQDFSVILSCLGVAIFFSQL